MDPTYILILFIISLASFLLIARKNIAIAMFSAAFILSITLPLQKTVTDLFNSFTDPRTLSLAVATGLIPVIGGLMNDTGLMDEMIRNLKISRRAFLGISPALFGMLPMPGGALLSAPMVDKIGGADVSKELKATANVWFRHIFILFYPMSSALIISTEVARVPMYAAIMYLSIFVFLSIIVGYVFYLRKVPSDKGFGENAEFRKFLIPLLILLIAPVIDFTIKTYGNPQLATYSTLIAVLSSFGLLLLIGRPSMGEIKEATIRMSPWNFFFLMIGITFYLFVFLDSGIPTLIKNIPLNNFILLVAIPFALGFATGRVMTPASILYPIYIVKFGPMNPLFFSVTYVTIFMGYIISPVHPCLILTADYFKVDVNDIIKKGAPAALIITAISAFITLV
ncbi:MAG: DUF401 family protein [Candidatus Njordarchaeia archaeon]